MLGEASPLKMISFYAVNSSESRSKGVISVFTQTNNEHVFSFSEFFFRILFPSFTYRYGVTF